MDNVPGLEAVVSGPGGVDLTYFPGVVVRRVFRNGCVKIRNVVISLSQALSEYNVGLKNLDSRRYLVWCCRLCVGEIDLETERFQAAIA